MTRTIAAGDVIRCTAPAVTALTVPARITAADQSTRMITGRIVTYGAVGHTAMGRVRFAAGSIAVDADPSAVKMLVEHDVSQIVGYGKTVDAAGDDLVASFYVAPGAVGDDVLASAANKLRDGLSVGVQVIDGAMGADGVFTVTAAVLREVSAVAVPAFSNARMTEVAASGHQLQPVQQYAPAPIYLPGPAQFSGAAGGATTEPRGESYEDALVRMHGAYLTGGVAGLVSAALTDVVGPTDTIANQPERDAFNRPGWLGELWRAENIERPLIDAFGPKPLTTMKVTGFRTVRPAYGVEEYAGRKAPIPSPGNVTLEPAEAKARRAAGGHDFDRIWLDLGDRSLFDQYLRIQTQNYGVLVESWFATFLQSIATVGGTVSTPLAALTRAARQFRKIGARTNVVAMGGDVFEELLDTPKDKAPWLFDGTAEIDGSTARVGNITFTVNESLPARGVLVGDKRSASFYEHSNPPIHVEALNIPNGGIDIAVFGYVAMLENDASALYSFTVAEPVVVEGA